VIYRILTGVPPYRNDEPRHSAVLDAYRYQETRVWHTLNAYPRLLRESLMDALRVDQVYRARDLWALEAAILAKTPRLGAQTAVVRARHLSTFWIRRTRRIRPRRAARSLLR
jgi:hypothetical protein